MKNVVFGASRDFGVMKFCGVLFLQMLLLAMLAALTVGCATSTYMAYSADGVSDQSDLRLMQNTAERSASSLADQVGQEVAGSSETAIATSTQETSGVSNSDLLKRAVIYNGELTVLTPDPNGTVQTVRKLAESVGGYASSIQDRKVVIRVPADVFDSVVQQLSELGLVTSRQIDAMDVTDKMVDLEIRIDNLVVLRDRLKNLLDQAESVEDMLSIEKELGRLTGELERIQGRLRLMRDQVSMSTIVVSLNTPKGSASGLDDRIQPFRWVTRVGAEAFGTQSLPSAQYKLGKGPKLKLPAGFVRFYQNNHDVFAINRDQVVLKVTRQMNYDKADTLFWVQQVSDQLAGQLGVPISEVQTMTTAGKDTVYVITGERPSGQVKLGYFVGLVSSDQYVYLVEAWGKADLINQSKTDLVESAQTLRVTKGWW